MPTPKRPRESAASLADSAERALERGEVTAGRDLAERALSAADRHPEGSARSRARRVLALALLREGRTEDAARVAEEAARVAHAARVVREESLAELLLAEVASARGDAHEEMQHATKAAALASRGTDESLARPALAAMGSALAAAGDGERARDALAEAIELPASGHTLRAFRVFERAAANHRAAGRYAEAIATVERAEAWARARGLEVAWDLAEARALVLIDAGAIAAARALVAEHDPAALSAARRSAYFGLRAAIAQADGERPELVERLVEEALAKGLAGAEVDPPRRLTLERLRALALHARGRSEEAERIAVDAASTAARLGARAQGAHALAVAARAGSPDAWLLRWLGALALAQNGVAARVEHEALAALVGEPDPIGAFARSTVATTRARLIAHTPPALRPEMKRTLRQVELRLVALRQARRAEAETSLDDFVVRAKDEVGLAGSSPSLLRPVAILARAAKSNASLVVTGETGSGKELFARLAHRLSPRKNGPFVAINCAAIPEALLEAELFGHERGAFTGAERARKGLFVEAEGGTLLLDEVGEMSAAMQAKLLRVLEDREVRAIGGTRGRKVDVRVVAATHRDLAKLVAANVFREDLFYRLAAITVRVPALRERPEDIPAIARALLARDRATAHHRFDVPALSALAEHAWPGNVRELANVIRVSAAMTEGTVIGRPELAEAIGTHTQRGEGPGPLRALGETTLAALRARHRTELRELVGRAIAGADGNKLRAARALGVSRQGLYRVIE